MSIRERGALMPPVDWGEVLTKAVQGIDTVSTGLRLTAIIRNVIEQNKGMNIPELQGTDYTVAKFLARKIKEIKDPEVMNKFCLAFESGLAVEADYETRVAIHGARQGKKGRLFDPLIEIRERIKTINLALFGMKEKGRAKANEANLKIRGMVFDWANAPHFSPEKDRIRKELMGFIESFKAKKFYESILPLVTSVREGMERPQIPEDFPLAVFKDAIRRRVHSVVHDEQKAEALLERINHWFDDWDQKKGKVFEERVIETGVLDYFNNLGMSQDPDISRLYRDIVCFMHGTRGEMKELEGISRKVFMERVREDMETLQRNRNRTKEEISHMDALQNELSSSLIDLDKLPPFSAEKMERKRAILASVRAQRTVNPDDLALLRNWVGKFLAQPEAAIPLYFPVQEFLLEIPGRVQAFAGTQSWGKEVTKKITMLLSNWEQAKGHGLEESELRKEIRGYLTEVADQHREISGDIQNLSADIMTFLDSTQGGIIEANFPSFDDFRARMLSTSDVIVRASTETRAFNWSEVATKQFFPLLISLLEDWSKIPYFTLEKGKKTEEILGLLKNEAARCLPQPYLDRIQNDAIKFMDESRAGAEKVLLENLVKAIDQKLDGLIGGKAHPQPWLQELQQYIVRNIREWKVSAGEIERKKEKFEETVKKFDDLISLHRKHTQDLEELKRLVSALWV